MILGFLALVTNFKGFKGLLEILNCTQMMFGEMRFKNNAKNQIEVMGLMNICLCEKIRG